MLVFAVEIVVVVVGEVVVTVSVSVVMPVALKILPVSCHLLLLNIHYLVVNIPCPRRPDLELDVEIQMLPDLHLLLGRRECRSLLVRQLLS